MHHFQDITTYMVYETACDLQKSFSLDKTVKITGHKCSPIHVKTWYSIIIIIIIIINADV